MEHISSSKSKEVLLYCESLEISIFQIFACFAINMCVTIVYHVNYCLNSLLAAGLEINCEKYLSE